MVKLPPPIWTLLFLISTAGISYLAGSPTSSYVRSARVGWVLIAVSFIPPIWAVVEFRRQGTQLSVESVTNNKLVTDGPFRFTRNPMYLGLVILSFGVAVTTGARAMFAAPLLVFATVNWFHIPFEEAKMRRQFGAAFDDYVRRVRRWV